MNIIIPIRYMRYFFISFAVFCLTNVSGQRNEDLKTGNPKVDAYIERCKEFEATNPNRSLELIDSALLINRQTKPIKDSMLLFFEKGYYEYNASNFTQAIKIYEQCNHYFIEKNDFKYRAMNQLRSSYANVKINNPIKANEQAISALMYYEFKKDTLYIAYCYNIIGVILRYQRDFKKSDSYFKRIIAIEAPGIESAKYKAIENLGINLCMQREFEEALLCFKESEKLALQMNDSIKLAGAFNNIGIAYYQIDSIDKALEYHGKNVKFYTALNMPLQLARSYNNLGNCFLDKGDNKKALHYFHVSIVLSEDLNYLENLQSLYWNSALAYYRLGDYQMGYQQLRKRVLIANELFDEKLAAKIKELNTIYEVEKHQENIAVLKKENEYKERENRQKSIIIAISLALLIVLLVLIVLVYFYYRNKRAADRLVGQQEIEKGKQELISLMKEHEVEIIETALLSQNKERKRIAIDIHDRLGVLLASIKLHFDSLNSLFSAVPEELGKFNTVNTLIDRACSDLRTIAHDIDSGDLSKFGLMHALGDLTKTIESAKSIRFDIQEFGLEKRIKNTAEIEIYRIIQEITANIIKHANATKVVIQFNRHDTDLNILVEDNGIGFDPTTEMGRGMGLKNLFSRVDKLNGTINIDSHPGRGTTVIIDLPNAFRND